MTSASECTETWRKRVSAYHDGGVLGEERAAVEAHLRTCQPCQELLRSYDHLYRELRSLPGFEGVLTITKPGSRRGLGATAKPSLTWPGKSLNDLNGHHPRGGAGGGTIVVTLLILLGLAFLIGREANVISPNAVVPQSTASVHLPIAPPAPTFGAVTPGGTACANRGASSKQTYAYGDAAGNIYQITDCADPVKLATLPFKDYDLGAWAPDASGLLVFTPARAHRTLQTRTQLAIVSPGSGVKPVNLPGNYTADDAVWTSSKSLIVRSRTTVLLVNPATNNITVLPMSATQIAWRGNELYYSTVQQGRASLHQYDLSSKADTTLVDLGVGQTACTTYLCWTNEPWDVSNDGAWVAYQYPVAAAVPSSTNAGAPANLVMQDLQSSTHVRAQVMALPISGALISLAIAPNDRSVAAVGMLSTQSGPQFMLGTLDGKVLAQVAVHGRMAWRPDSQALVVMPMLPSTASNPALIDAAHGTSSPLVPDTTGYSWQ